MFLRRVVVSKKEFHLPIISVGNLTVGGSGKSPFLIEVVSRYKDVYVISRGYARQSRGLVEVSYKGEIFVDVFQSGDEPMLIAKSLPNASVIVNEDRVVAIELAKKRGAKIIFLDDGFNRVNIKKFDILLFPQNIRNFMPFPAGPFREFIFTKVFADLNLIENRDFKRVVDIANIKDKMLLVTAISNPYRLEPFLPSDNIVEKIYLKDHAYFDEKSLKEKMLLTGANSLLVTQKDEVKMENFKLELSVMRLKLEIKKEVIKRIDEYIDSYKE